jgi:DNA-binding response OmpR family regulator
LEAGFDAFLAKPIDPRVVVSCVRALCDHPGSQENT